MRSLMSTAALGLIAGLAVADPGGDDMAVTPQAGTWMVCVASFPGADAPDLARQLCEEIRGRHRLPAYVFNYEDQERARQKEEYEQRKREHPDIYIRPRFTRVEKYCTVLIGGYPDMDAANAALVKIKKLPKPALRLSSGQSPFDSIVEWVPNGQKQGADVMKAEINPFTRGFVTRNPTLPPEKRTENKADPLWAKLNPSGMKHNLLDNSSPYTLKVKEYFGKMTVDNKADDSAFERFLHMGARPGESLNAASKQAEELANFLRHPKIGLKAYVLNTRYSSMVTVGGFAGPNDPELERVRQQLSKLKFSQGAPTGTPISLIDNPVVMEVPHR